MFKNNYKYQKKSCIIGLLLLLAQCFVVVKADVVIDSLIQSPANPVIAGSTVTYALTVTNPVRQPAVFVDIDILLADNRVSQIFTTTDCELGGVFFCGELATDSSQTYVFSTIINDPAELPFEFLVSCGEVCNAGSLIVSPATIVVAGSVSTTELNLSAAPGALATGTVTVSNSGQTTISAVSGQVTPTNLPAGGGDVIYSLFVSADTPSGEIILDTITIVDEAGNRSVIAVEVTAAEVSTGFADTPGLTENEIQVAEALEIACSELRKNEVIIDTPLKPVSGTQAKSTAETQAQLLSVCNALDDADSATILSALQQITPTQVPAQADLSVQSSNTQLNNVTARLSALRGGASGYSVMGLTLNYGGLSLPANLFVNHQNNVISGVNEDSKDLSILPKLGVFINGTVSFGDKDDTVDELGFDFNTYGFTAGADYRITDSLITGGALGIVNTDSDFNHSQGNVDISGLSLLAYSTYFLNEATYLEGVISFGRNNFTNSRNINVGSINYEARGKTDGNEKTVSVGAGYDFSKGSTTLGSYLKLNYVRADIDAYSESSNSGLELSFQKQSSESLTMNFGGQLSYAVSMDYGIILPTLRIDWIHEYQDDSRFVTASFVNDPSQTEFSIATASPDRDYFQLGLGASATFGLGRSAYFFYESIVGQSTLTQNSLTGGLRIDF